MLGVQTVKITQMSLDHHHRYTYGGYFTYWKMYGVMLKMMKSTRIKPNIIKRIWTFIWFCLFKPLVYFYSHKISLVGDFEIRNNQYTNKGLVKSKTHMLFGIPVFYRNLKIDVDEILEFVK